MHTSNISTIQKIIKNLNFIQCELFKSVYLDYNWSLCGGFCNNMFADFLLRMVKKARDIFFFVDQNGVATLLFLIEILIQIYKGTFNKHLKIS